MIAVALAAAALAGQSWSQQDSLHLRPSKPLQEFVLDNERRLDPEYDRWRSEQLHDAAKPILKHFLHDLAEGGAFDESEWSEDFWHSDLRPELTTVHADGVVVVRRAESVGAERRERALLAQSAREFRAAAPSGSSLGTFVLKTVSVELDAEDVFRVRCFLYAHTADASQALQWNACFDSHWRVGAAADAVELTGIELLEYEEVLGPAGLLPDYAEAAFGSTPGWKEQLLTGTAAWTERVDRHFGRSFLGTQGLAVGDVDGDGRDDLYFCQQAGIPNRLWLARADGSAEDAAPRLGLDFLDKTRSALIADFDGDGRQDLAVSLGTDVVMCWQGEDGRFTASRLRGPGGAEIYSLAAADADGDADLDLYACRYIAGGLLAAVPSPYHDATNGAPNIYWRNGGAREFAVATAEAGFDHDNDRFSFAALWEDFDDDGDADLYVVNDFGRNCLYLNEDGRFRNVADERGAADLAAGMGATAADADGDGDLDLYVTNMFSSAGRRIATQEDRFMEGEQTELHQHYVRHARGNSLLLNDGSGNFRDATEACGAEVGFWGWGALFFELDNDGLPDIYAPNGFLSNSISTDL